MPNQGPFPSKEADLNLYFQTVIAYLILNGVRLNVSAANLAAASDLLALWEDIFPSSQNKNTRTKTIVENKDVAKERMMTLLRSIYADIAQSALTNEDRNTLNLEARSTSRTASPVPVTRPVAQVNTNNRLEHTISFTDESGSSARPAGVRGCQIWFNVGEPIINVEDLDFMATDTASPYIRKFPLTDAGKAVHYWLRWENTRGETGPWSTVVTATITG
jgi:hypothetical protein